MSLTSGFVDLATYDELEKYFYGGAKATTYFVRKTRKASWFTQVPVTLSGSSGLKDFGQEWSVSISRAGDYLLHNWLRVTIPAVTPDTGRSVRWTRNLMHNLVEKASIRFNDLVEAEFDSNFLDFWTAFTVPAGKRVGYDNMIGNIESLINPAGGDPLPSTTLVLPLPFPHTRDTGVSLPTAALPYNEMRILIKFRKLDELLIAEDEGGLVVTAPAVLGVDTKETSLSLSNVEMWANYAIVSNAERVKMGAAPRDMAIEQFQTALPQTANLIGASSITRDLRLSHAVKVLFFGVENTTNSAERSNYTSATPVRVSSDAGAVDFNPPKATDPIALTTIRYENTARLQDMGSDFFSLVQPYYQCRTFSIPTSTGYHMYSYSLDLLSIDPMGSTNFGKLTNISLTHQFSAEAIAGATAGPDAGSTLGHTGPQTFRSVACVVNNNVVRVSGGALGFPVL